MKAELIKREGNSVTFDMVIDANEFENAIERAYKKNKSRYNIPGFRKGKAPRKIIELNYGKGVFFNDALDIILPEVYPTAVDELGLAVVSSPELDIKEIGEDGSVKMEATVYVKPEFDIANYKGIEIEKENVDVTDEMVDAELEALREKQSRTITIDTPIENGNIAVIDFKGLLDGVPFDGGSAEGYSLEIGSGTFIPGFEEQLLGKSAGDEVEVNVTFPEDYPAEELAGKPVVFKVKINEVKAVELPELDDDFAKDTTEFESLEELKNDIRTRLEERAANEAETIMKNKAVEAVAALTEIDIPEPMIEAQLENIMRDIDMQLSYQGWSLEKFAELSGQSIDEIKASRREEAVNLVKNALIVEKIAELENIEVTEEELEEDLKKFAEMYQMELDKIRHLIGAEEREAIENRIKSEKTVKLLLDNAKIK